MALETLEAIAKRWYESRHGAGVEAPQESPPGNGDGMVSSLLFAVSAPVPGEACCDRIVHVRYDADKHVLPRALIPEVPDDLAWRLASKGAVCDY
jgi:hypothetical protein